MDILQLKYLPDNRSFTILLKNNMNQLGLKKLKEMS